MKNLQVLTTSFILGSFVLVSCSTNKIASNPVQDNLYFMASDAKIATEFAVQNNNPESFKSLAALDAEAYSQENFSSRNVNPDYIAKYQSDTKNKEDGTVYFDEAGDTDAAPDINVYNNYYSNAGGGINSFNSPFSVGLGLGYGFGGFGMGGFYNPFYGFGSGFNMNMGFGWGSPFMRMGLGFGNPMFGYPVFPMYGFGNPMFGFGNPMFGFGNSMLGFGNSFYGYPGFRNPIFILPGGEYGDRRAVVGARPTRGASLSGAGYGGSSNSAIVPNTARAQARNEALSNSSNNRRVVSSSENSRISSRDFSTSQNDYYSNSRSRIATSGTTRNVNSPAVDRGVTNRSRSAMPASRPSSIGGGTNSRSSDGTFTTPSRSTSSPNYNRSSSPSYNRSTAPSYNQRSTNPAYNRSTTPSRNNSSGYSAPSRSSSGPSISAPSRSSGGSTGTSSGGSRSGRGN